MANQIRSTLVSLSIAFAVLGASGFAQAPTIQKEFTIGCESCGGALEFSNIADVGINSRGDVLVADKNAPFLREFSSTGKPLWSGGAKGKGPGEYIGITRIAWLSNGSYVIVDGSGNRVTALTPEHTVATTTPLIAYSTTAAANNAGLIILGQELPMGRGFELFKWKTGVLDKIVPTVPAGKPAPTFDGASVAVAPNGNIALWPDANRYEIIRMDAAGLALPGIVRTVERVRYTVVEDSIRREHMARSMAQMRKMAGITSGPPVAKPEPLQLKAHIYGDGMRYDPQGRLWVQTMRGNETHTVFDVFSPTGTFVGSVNMPEVVKQFALGGTWLVTASENEDGVPIVTRWRVR
ncbi:MAG: hypothetical protein ABJB74_17835 [Gemmatimonas sp.]